MKKITFLFTVFTLIAGGISQVVSCVAPAFNQGKAGERITLITDAGRVTDKSFNQAMYEALITYSERSAQLPPSNFIADSQTKFYGGFDFSKRHLSVAKNYVQPLKTDFAGLVAAYKVATLKGTDILILSGFQHAATITNASQILGLQKTLIFVDSPAGAGIPNVINLVYNSQLAGFAAGYNAAVWGTTIIKDQNSKDGWRYQGALHDDHHFAIGLFGGLSNKMAVDNYLWGMMVAINYFNHLSAELNEKTPPEMAAPLRKVFFANAGKEKDVLDITNIQATNPNYFSGSFEPGGAIKSGITSFLKENKADVIFPVAGPQTLDTLTTTEANLIGVDSDQSLQYLQSAQRFVTSATKDLKASLFDAFDHAKANLLNHDQKGVLLPQPAVATDPTDHYWDGTIAPSKPEWSIAIDQTINPKGAKFPKSLVVWGQDEKLQPLAEILVNYYLDLGEITPEYLNKNAIAEATRRLLAPGIPRLPIDF